MIFCLIFGPNPEARQYTCPHLKSRTLHVSSGCSVMLGFVGQLGLAEITLISGSATAGQINPTYPLSPRNYFGPLSRPQLYPCSPRPHSLDPRSPCFQRLIRPFKSHQNDYPATFIPRLNSVKRSALNRLLGPREVVRIKTDSEDTRKYYFREAKKCCQGQLSLFVQDGARQSIKIAVKERSG